jgi:quercetin dioxygenase-like cupin family protein
MRQISLLAGVVCLLIANAMAQDPVKVDPSHYKVEFENAQVRVLRIHYGPHEKSVMHDHPPGVAVFLTDQHGKFSYPDGKTQEFHLKKGETNWGTGGKHLPENLSDQPFELILVEIKGVPAPSGKYSIQ